MRILFVCLSYVPASGAPTELTYLTRLLASKGHEVSVYTTNMATRTSKLYPTTEVHEMNGVRMHFFDGRRLAGSFVYSPELFEAVHRDVDQFDIVHLYGYRSAQTTVAARAAQRAGVPYVLTARGSIPYTQGNAPFKRVFDWLVGNRLLRGAAKLLPFNNFERQHYLDHGLPEAQLENIPLGIDATQYERLPPLGQFRARWRLEGKRIALFLGRFNRIKGLDMLLPAWAEAVRQVPDLHLCLAGSDSGQLENVRRQIGELRIESSVTIVGYVQGEEKLAALVDCDLMVLPSRFDLFPNVLCEAWACGKPVVITDRCGIADLVAEERLGLVAPFEAQPFAECIVRMARDGEMAAEMGRRGREYVQTEFDSKKIADRHEALYASLVTRPPQPDEPRSSAVAR